MIDSTDQDYLDVAAAIQKQIRERKPGTTAMAAMAQGLRGFEQIIAGKYAMLMRQHDAAIVDTFATIERYKGAGAFLRQQNGEADATEELINLYTWRYNLAKDIAAAIRAGKFPDMTILETGQERRP